MVPTGKRERRGLAVFLPGNLFFFVVLTAVSTARVIAAFSFEGLERCRQPLRGLGIFCTVLLKQIKGAQEQYQVPPASFVLLSTVTPTWRFVETPAAHISASR